MNPLETHQRHIFILKLKTSCGDECHKPLKSVLDKLEPNHNYQLITHDYVYVTLLYHHIKQIQSEYSNFIIEFTSLIPEMKLDPFIQTRIDTIASNTIIDEECHNYLIEFTAMNEIELNSLKLKIETIILNKSYKFEYNVLQTNKQRYAYLNSIPNSLKKCDNSNNNNINNELLLLNQLLKLNEINYIENRSIIIKYNRWGRGCTQTGVYNNAPLYPNANITGLNEIIGISDTGIDMKSCYFYDPNHKPPYQSVNFNHRKVVYYTDWSETDLIDDSTEAHGTHVAGSFRSIVLLTFTD